mmetsp:Transcript_1808/g.4240  ORF Transcript_1808/g.4240 Transcript_1808/m.4240 type:complete len:261 (-) Transcript_1808:44-826(-)
MTFSHGLIAARTVSSKDTIDKNNKYEIDIVAEYMAEPEASLAVELFVKRLSPGHKGITTFVVGPQRASFLERGDYIFGMKIYFFIFLISIFLYIVDAFLYCLPIPSDHFTGVVHRDEFKRTRPHALLEKIASDFSHVSSEHLLEDSQSVFESKLRAVLESANSNLDLFSQAPHLNAEKRIIVSTIADLSRHNECESDSSPVVICVRNETNAYRHSLKSQQSRVRPGRVVNILCTYALIPLICAVAVASIVWAIFRSALQS